MRQFKLTCLFCGLELYADREANPHPADLAWWLEHARDMHQIPPDLLRMADEHEGQTEDGRRELTYIVPGVGPYMRAVEQPSEKDERDG